MFKNVNRKRLLYVLTSAIMAISTFGAYSPISRAAEGTVQVEYQKTDLEEIPDKYNCGVKGDLKTVILSGGLENIVGKKNTIDCNLELKKSGTSDNPEAQNSPITYMINFSRDNNKILGGEIVFENYDFSQYRLSTASENAIAGKLTLVFNNCKFNIFSTEYPDSKINYKFNNCSIRRFWGSNASFDRCAFGGSWEDPLHPLRNIEVKNSYFSDLNHETEAGSHIDGMQIMGYRRINYETNEVIETIDSKDIKFQNCRFEVPYIQLENTAASVNSCIMIQPEYSNAYDISVKDCILNGGGYSIYCQTRSGILLKNISFDNVKVGAAQYHGIIYPNIDKTEVHFNNVAATNSLYIGSVFKDDGYTRFSVNNDTGRKRNLRIITDTGSYDFEIDAGPTRKTLDNRTFKSFNDLPIDRLMSIEGDLKYAVCYDVTNPKEYKQIRFVNYTEDTVSFDSSKVTEGIEYENSVIAEGSCGVKGADNLHYKLTEDGVMTISGTGKMDDYHSKYLPPWDEYKYDITKVVVEEGVTGLGNQAFNGCICLEKVKLPDTIEKLGVRCFAKCNSLIDINIPDSLTNIGDNAFTDLTIMMAGLDIKSQNNESSEGSSEESSEGSSESNLKDGSDNDLVKPTNTKANEIPNKNTVQDKTKTNQFKVGKTIKDKKTGFVYKVKGGKKTPELALVKVPKKSAKVTVKSVVRISGKKCKVTSIGMNAFKGNKKVKQITIEKGITKISKGAFKGCKNLKKMKVKNKKLSKKYLKKIGLNSKVKVVY